MIKRAPTILRLRVKEGGAVDMQNYHFQKKARGNRASLYKQFLKQSKASRAINV